jgi:hypothetical protein
MNYVTSVHVTDRECLAPVPLRITRSTIPQIQAAKNASINLTPSTDRLTAFARDLSTRCDGSLHCKRNAAAPAMLVIPMILVLFNAVRCCSDCKEYSDIRLQDPNPSLSIDQTYFFGFSRSKLPVARM